MCVCVCVFVCVCVCVCVCVHARAHTHTEMRACARTHAHRVCCLCHTRNLHNMDLRRTSEGLGNILDTCQKRKHHRRKLLVLGSLQQPHNFSLSAGKE